MLMVESALEILDLLSKALRRILVVVEMNFHRSKSVTSELRQRLHAFGRIFLLRIEKVMLWRSSAIVAERVDYAWVARPPVDPLESPLVIGVSPVGLEMIDQAKENMAGTFTRLFSSVQRAAENNIDVFSPSQSPHANREA
jgi:hypothetical protein